jgi:hypothetical protein
MAKKLIKLLIFLAFAFAGWHAIPPYFTYVEFRDDVHEAARYSGGRSEKELRDLIVTIAQDRGVPLDPDTVTIERTRTMAKIDASYVQPIELLPRYFYDWQYDVKVEVLLARPMKADEIR